MNACLARTASLCGLAPPLLAIGRRGISSMQSARFLIAAAAMALAASAMADPVLAPPAQPAAEVQPFVKVPAGRIAITHVRVIDGTGAAPADDRTILLDGARIAAVQESNATIPEGY